MRSSYVFILFVLLLVTGSTAVSDEIRCDTTTVKSELTEKLDSIKDYQVEARVLFAGNDVHTQITGKLPDRLRVQMKSSQPLVSWTVVFDGSNQWVETVSGESSEVMRIQLPAVVDSRRPFDTGYYLMGSSLLHGEDFIGTLRTLVASYDLTAECGQEIITLSGPLNTNRFKRYAQHRRGGFDEESVRQFINNFGYISLELEARSFLISGFVLGPGKELTDDSFQVVYDQILVNPGLPADEFEYHIPDGATAVDLTSAILERVE